MLRQLINLASRLIPLWCLTSVVSAQTVAAQPAGAAPTAKAAPTSGMPQDIAQKLYDLGFPATGENIAVGLAQWRVRKGRKTIGTLSAEEATEIQREPLPTTFGAFLGSPFAGYGLSSRRSTRYEATAAALEECRRRVGSTCVGGQEIVFTGRRCLALAGYQDQIGADGKSYTAYAPSVGDSADVAAANAVRNCATDGDGKTYCRVLFVQCADGPRLDGPRADEQLPEAASAARAFSAPAPAPVDEPPPMIEIATKLYLLGYPVSGRATDDPTAAISQWRFRSTGKPSREPLTAAEIQSIMSTPHPTRYGAFAGTTFSGFGLITQTTSRAHAESEAMARCLQGTGVRGTDDMRGKDCERAPPMVVAGARCLAYAGFHGALKNDGKLHTLSATGLSDDLEGAIDVAMQRCGQDPENKPLCAPLVAICADGRQIDRVNALPPVQR